MHSMDPNALTQHLETAQRLTIGYFKIHEMKPANRLSDCHFVNGLFQSGSWQPMFCMPLEIHEVIIITLLFYQNHHDPFF